MKFRSLRAALSVRMDPKTRSERPPSVTHRIKRWNPPPTVRHPPRQTAARHPENDKTSAVLNLASRLLNLTPRPFARSSVVTVRTDESQTHVESPRVPGSSGMALVGVVAQFQDAWSNGQGPKAEVFFAEHPGLDERRSQIDARPLPASPCSRSCLLCASAVQTFNETHMRHFSRALRALCGELAWDFAIAWDGGLRLRLNPPYANT